MKKIVSLILCTSLILSTFASQSAFASTNQNSVALSNQETIYITKTSKGDFSKASKAQMKDNSKIVEIQEKGVGKDIYEGNDKKIYLEVQEGNFLEAEEITISRNDTYETIVFEYGVSSELANAIIAFFASNEQPFTTVYKPIDYIEMTSQNQTDGIQAQNTFISRNYYIGYKNYQYMAEYWYKGKSESGWNNFATGSNPRSYSQNLAKYIAGILLNFVESKIEFPAVTIAQLFGVSADQIPQTGSYSHLIYLKEEVTEKWVYIYMNGTYTLGYKGQSANVTWSHRFIVGINDFDRIKNETMRTVLTPNYLSPDVIAYNYWHIAGYFDCFDYQEYKSGTATFNYDSIGDY